MTRLESVRRKRKFSQFFFGAVFLVLLAVFLATVGFKLILSAALFVSEKTHQKTEVKEQNDELLVAPSFAALPNATNSASIVVAGYSNSKKTIALFVNGEKQKELIPEDGQFETKVQLSEGENEIYAEIETDKNGETKKSNTHIVIYKTAQLELTIDAPTEGEKTTKDEIIVKGGVNSDAEVKVNGQPAITNSDNVFSKTIRLQKGDNVISIDAKDDAGNSVNKTITVKYEPDE